VPWSVLEVLIETGLDGLADAMDTLMNEAMKIERSRFPGAEPHERSAERIDYNRCRPHSSLGDRTPEEFREKCPQAG